MVYNLAGAGVLCWTIVAVTRLERAHLTNRRQPMKNDAVKPNMPHANCLMVALTTATANHCEDNNTHFTDNAHTR